MVAAESFMGDDYSGFYDFCRVKLYWLCLRILTRSMPSSSNFRSDQHRVFNRILPMVSEGTLLQSLTPDAVTAVFKIKYFVLRTAVVDKDEQLPTK